MSIHEADQQVQAQPVTWPTTDEVDASRIAFPKPHQWTAAKPAAEAAIDSGPVRATAVPEMPVAAPGPPVVVPVALPPRPPSSTWTEASSVEQMVREQPDSAAMVMRAMLLDGQGQAGDPQGPAQVGAVCIGLGAEVSGEVLKHLNDHEVEQVTQCTASLKNITPEIIDQVFEEP